MGINEVKYEGQVIMSTRNDTVTPETLLQGVTATDCRGDRIVGTYDPSAATADAYQVTDDIAESIENSDYIPFNDISDSVKPKKKIGFRDIVNKLKDVFAQKNQAYLTKDTAATAIDDTDYIPFNDIDDINAPKKKITLANLIEVLKFTFTSADIVSTERAGLAPNINDENGFLKGNGVWTVPPVVSTSGNGYAPKVTNTSYYLRGDATWQPLYEANIAWGGKNFAGAYGCIDASMVDELGADRLMFAKAAGITVEYSRDGGSTWIDYEADNAKKVGLFSTSGSFLIGKADSSNKATAHGTDYQLRVTLDSSLAAIYTQLLKFVIYCSTNGSNSSTVTIQKALKTSETNFVNVASNVTLKGWSGYNVINVTPFTTYGNAAQQSTQYSKIRFIFKANGGDTNYNGLTIYRIMGFGGVGWTAPSKMAKNRHLYSWDSSQNATFPANLKMNNGTQVAYVTDTPVVGNIIIADDLTGGIKASDVPIGTIITDTTYSLSADGENAKLTSSSGVETTAPLSDLITGLPIGDKAPTDSSYLIWQYVGTDTTKTNQYYRKPASLIWNYIKGKIGISSGSTFLRKDGTWADPVGTTYTLSADGSNVKLTPSSGTADSVPLSNLITGLEVGTATPTDDQYYVSQYAGTDTSKANVYYRRPMSLLWTYIKGKIGISSGSTYLKKDGTWGTPTNTTYTLSADGENVKLTPSSGSATTAKLSTLIGNLGVGTSDPVDTSYFIAQGVGSSYESNYYKKPMSLLWNYIKGKIGISSGSTYLKKDGTWGTPTNTSKSFYGTSSTGAATATKVVTLSNTTGWSFVAGVVVGVKMTESNTASNVQLNVNGSGAKSIYYNGAVYTGNAAKITGWASHVIYYMYDGTYWVFLNNDANYQNTNTTYTAGTALALDGTTFNVTTVPIANGGTGATTRLDAAKALTNENVGTSAAYFVTLTSSWGKFGYTSVANAKTVLGLGSAAYTPSTDYWMFNGGATAITGTSSAHADLNTYKTAGNYTCTTNATSAYVDNQPVTAGTGFDLKVMKVLNSATYIRQMYWNHNSNTIYIRRSTDSGSTWSSWTNLGANTTYSAGTGLTLSSTTFSISKANVSTIINLLDTGTSTPVDADYYVAQYAGGGTTTTTYVRKPMSSLYAYIKAKTDTLYATSSHTHTLSLATDSGTSAISLAANTKYKLTAGGKTLIFTTPVDSDTKYTAATAAPGAIASAGAAGTSTNYARQDHTHAITVATGDSNGQVKVAGQNASVKGINTAAYQTVDAFWRLNGGSTAIAATEAAPLDLNTYITPGNYHATATPSTYISNQPVTAGSNFSLVVMKIIGNANYFRQFYMLGQSSGMYTRQTKDAGANWSSWIVMTGNTTYSSKAAASGGTDVSLCTTGEKYTWNNKSDLAIGTSSTTAAAGNHTHTLSLATDSGTSTVSLAANTVYKLTAGGKTLIFTTPPDNNTTYTPQKLGFGYGTCATAAATTTKVVTLTDYVLVKNGYVSVKFTYAVPANAKLNINSKGEKSIFYKGAAIVAGVIKASDLVTFVYDGTQYHVVSIVPDQPFNLAISDSTYGYKKTDGTFVAFKSQADIDSAVAAAMVGTATAANVLSGKTFTNSTSSGISGTMTNNGTIDTVTLTAASLSYTIPKGYHSGSGKVQVTKSNTYKSTATSTNINASGWAATLNCGESVTVGAGAIYAGSVTANSLSSQTGVDSGKTAVTAATMLTGYQGWVNGSKITGTMTNNGAASATTLNPGGTYSVKKGYYSAGATITAASMTETYTITSSDANWITGNVDMGATNKCRYVNAVAVYNKGKADGAASSSVTMTFTLNPANTDFGLMATWSMSSAPKAGKIKAVASGSFLMGSISIGSNSYNFSTTERSFSAGAAIGIMAYRQDGYNSSYVTVTLTFN